MSGETPANPASSDLGAALGRVPSGLHVLTARRGDRETGMLASWVQQASFAPPMVSVAIQADRYLLTWLRESGGFVLNQIPEGDKRFLRHFGRGFGPDEPAFDGIAIAPAEIAEGPVLDEALGYLVVRLVGEVAAGDHTVVVGEVTAGRLLRPEGQPAVHVRRSGFHY